MHSERRKGPGLGAVALTILLAGCSLPAATPMRGAVERSTEYPVVAVDRALAKRLSQRTPARFGAEFTRAGIVDADRIHPGDQLNFQIFETVDAGLLGSTGRAPTLIGPIEVGGDGAVSLPYAGRIQANGRRLEDLRGDLETRLAEQTPNPQVIVTRESGSGFSVTVSGNASGGGVVPLNYGQRSLRAALAMVGGAQGDPALVTVEVMRAGKRGRARLDQIQTVPGQDIALRPGDAITVTTEKPRVAMLGASSSQGAVPLEHAGETLTAALARAGGLSANSGDAKGLFVLRSTNAATGSEKPEIYAFDMTQPEGIFAADAFALEDGDVVYVSEVAVSRAGRAVRALLGFTQPVDQITSLGG